MNRLLEKYDLPTARYPGYPTAPNSAGGRLPESAWLNHCASAIDADPRLSLSIQFPLGSAAKFDQHSTISQATSYLEHILAEWHLYQAHFSTPFLLRELQLVGAPCLFQPEQLGWLLASMLRGVTIPEDAELSFEARPADTTREHLLALHALGFRGIRVSLFEGETFATDLRHRTQTFEQVEQLTILAREIGYTKVHFNLSCGLPNQHKSDLFNTVSELRRVRPDRIAFSRYTPECGDESNQFSLEVPDFSTVAEKCEMYTFGRELLQAAGYVGIGLDHFALPGDALLNAAQNGTLHRNFTGYTTIYTPNSLGLGAAALSEMSGALIQNETTLAGYEASIITGKLPIFRGHFLDWEARCLRRHILNLSCRNHTEWYMPEQQIPAMLDVMERLAEFESDGLVEITPFSVSVKPAGSAYLRNICMAFDARYWSEFANFLQYNRRV
jgi:oxygen-independent coproporphyrinogen-3 oxidase